MGLFNKRKVTGTKTASAARQRCRVEALEPRRLLSVSWFIDSNRTLQVTTDDNNNDIRFATFVSDASKLDFWDQGPNIHYSIPLANFDRINVQMGAASDFNYVEWVDQYEGWAGPLTKPATLDLGGGAGAQNIMFFYTSGAASLSGDGRIGGQFNHTGEPGAAAVTFGSAPSTRLIGDSNPNSFDASAFTGDLWLQAEGGDANLVGGTGVTTYLPGADGNVTVRMTGGRNLVDARGTGGNDTIYGCSGNTGVRGGAGNVTFYDGGGRVDFEGGSGNNTYYGSGTDGPDVIAAGTSVDDPSTTEVVFNNSNHSAYLRDVQNVRIDAGGGVDDGVIPTVPLTGPLFDPLAGPLDPNVNLQITHLEPTVDAGPDASLDGTGAFAGSGSFRDIGDPTNAWTATVDYGDGTGAHPPAINPTVISTADGPAHPFDLSHDYAAAGSYTVTVTVTDAEGDVGTGTRTVNVANLARPTQLSLAAAIGIYGGTTSLTATLQANGAALAGASISFASAGGAPLGTATTDANGVATLANVSLAGLDAGSYANAFVASFAGDSRDLPSRASATLTVSPAPALTAYTGATLVTANSTGSAAVALRADLNAATGGTGDIRNATVTFLIYDAGGTLLATVPGAAVGLTTPTDTTTGSATATWTTNLGSAASVTYRVAVVVGHDYAGGTSSSPDLLTVSMPSQNMSTGGGFLLEGSSAGTYAADAGSRTDFGFNLRDTTGTAGGNINIIFRRTASDGTLHTYQIQGTVVSSYGADSATGRASTVATATLKDITNPSSVTVGSNLTLQMSMTDRGEPGTSDSLAITLWASDTLLFSSDWTGLQTVQDLLGGGNIQVH